MSRLRRSLFLSVLLVALGLIMAVSAQAKAPVYDFTMTTTSTQAGGHPDINTFIRMGNRATQDIPPPSCQCQDPKSINFHAPTGIIGVPRGLGQCSQSDFSESRCPIDTQVGVSEVGINSAGGTFNPTDPSYDSSLPCGGSVGGQLSCAIPVYNLVPHPGQAGLLGFYAPYINTPIYIVVDARTESDYGLEFSVSGILHTLALGATGLTLWGVPADSSHDKLRFGPVGCDSQNTVPEVPPCLGGKHSNASLAPFISNPTTCGASLTAAVDVLSYDREVDSKTIAFPTTTGCDRLSFNPSLFGQPTTFATDAASGLEIDLKAPQLQSPTTPSPSEIRGTTVTLPEGFSINPNAADGKEVCSDEQAKLGTRLQAECPENAKVGTLEVESDALPGPLPGYIYLRSPAPGDRYRLFLVADGFGLHVKLPGSVRADSNTGRLVTSFQDLPQFPFSRFNMHLFGSERGLLATPERCGVYSVDSTFTPWDSALPDQSSHQFFSITSGPGGLECPGGARTFDPTFEAGVTDKTAAKHTRFVLRMTREDGEQNLSALAVTTAPGFSARLKGIPYCPQAAIDQLASTLYTGLSELASSTCPADSQIGTAVAGAGAGSRPVYVTGKVYLAGPYKGAPLSLIVVIPAVSGPYDLGNVAVRAAISVDPKSAQVTAIADPLPQIIQGVPLRTRMVQVSLDRPNFALNPTNCDPFAVDAQISGDEGAIASLGNYFQVANCADLTYAPKLSLKLTGGVERRGHPAIHAVFKPSPDEANTRSVSVTLPDGELLDNAHIGTVCSRVEFARSACPESSRIGRARVTTPLLDRPLQGSAYLRSSSHDLPDIAIALHGQVDFELSLHVDSVNARLRTRLENGPDIPVTEFVLDLVGGRRGLLQNTESLCDKKPKRATTKMVGQNGVRLQVATKLDVVCDSKKRHRRHKQHVRRARKAV